MLTNNSFLRRYSRLKIDEVVGPIIDSSVERLCTFAQFPAPKTKEDVIKMLGDQSAKNHTVFRENGGREFIKTVAVGMKFIQLRMFSFDIFCHLIFKFIRF